MTEFAYNTSVNRPTGLSSFEAVTSCKPKKPVDLLIPIGAVLVHLPDPLPSMCMICILRFDNI